MKKSITILAIIAIALVAMMGSVSASSILTSAAKVDVEKPVTVTVKFDNPVRAVELNLKYDTNLFTYVSSDLGALGGSAKDLGDGILRVAKFGQDGASTSEIKFNFTAKTTAGTGDFSIVDGTLITDTNDSMPAAKGVEVVIPTEPSPEASPEVQPSPEVPGKEEPSPVPEDNKTAGKEDPKGDGKGDDTQTTEDGTPVDTNGAPITRLPDTGAPLYIGAAAVLVVAGAVLVVRKIRK